MGRKEKKVVCERQIGTRFKGITAAANRLGVTIQHLRKVLLGERESARLMREVKKNFPGLLGAGK